MAICRRISILISVFGVICHVSLALESDDLPSASGNQIMTPAELVAAEKAALEKPIHEIQIEPLHIPFDKDHYEYSTDEWKLVAVVKDQQASPLDTIMMLAAPEDPEKPVRISFDLPTTYSKFVLKYQVFISKNEENPPEFKVLLSSFDKMERVLKTEEPKGIWTNSTITSLSERKDKIVFQARQMQATNEIGLRYVTVQKLFDVMPERYSPGDSGNASFNRSITAEATLHAHSEIDELDNYTYNSSAKENALVEVVTNVSTTLLNGTNSTAQIFGSNLANISTVSEELTLSTEDVQTTTQISDLEKEAEIFSKPLFSNASEVAETQLPANLSLETVNITDRTTAVTTNDQSKNSSDLGFNDKNVTSIWSNSTSNNISESNTTPLIELVDSEAAINQTNGTNASLETRMVPSDFASTRGIFHFFLVIMLTSTVVFLFIYIRRRRRRRDDEIPVFRRSATEHGNPTYLDDDTELDTGFSSSNYRSFR